MKAVFVSHDSPQDVSGVSSWLRRLLPLLRARGLDIEVHLLQLENRPGANAAFFASEGFTVRSCQWRRDTARAARQLLRFLELAQPDAYILNAVVPAYHAARYAGKKGVCTVGVIHSDDEFYWGLADEFVFGSAQYRLSAVVAVSQFLFRAIDGRLKEKGITIPCRQIGYGVAIPETISHDPGETFTIAYVGRLVEEQKRIGKTVEAMILAAKRHQNLRGLIIGEGESRGAVEELLAGAGEEGSRIRLVGRVENSHIYKYLEKCDALVLLSDYEGLPVSALEAMACGVVPICLRTRSGIMELITTGLNGIIVNDRNESFLAAIDELICNKESRVAMGRNARALVQERFSIESSAAQWSELIGQLAPRPRDSRFRSPLYIRLAQPNPKLKAQDVRPGWMSLARRVAARLLPTGTRLCARALGR